MNFHEALLNSWRELWYEQKIFCMLGVLLIWSLSAMLFWMVAASIMLVTKNTRVFWEYKRFKGDPEFLD